MIDHGTPARRAPRLTAAAATVVALVLLLAPFRVGAQETSAAGPGLAPDTSLARRGGPEIFAIGGALAPLAQLSSDPGSFATEVSSSAAFGGTVGWWLPGGLGAGVQVLYAPATLNILPTSFQGPIPTDLGDAGYLAATAEVRYRLVSSGPAGVLAPYMALGGGIRRLNFDPIAQLDVQDTTDPVGTAAIGVESKLMGPLAVRLEVRDYLSSFDSSAPGDSHLQNDVLVTVGLGILP
ncbi:MAG TPA: hypothetical protein VKB18_03525 [Gemmatimonadota bacterium]|nr:hypothetical protein [Gemmatimonadota bacterium]